MARVLVVVSVLARCWASQHSATIHIHAHAPLSTTSELPIAFNLDWWANNATNNEGEHGLWQNASVLAIDLDNPRLKAAVQAFNRSILRIGGTLGDVATYDVTTNLPPNCPWIPGSNISYCLSMQRWDKLHAWCGEVGCRIAFGLNALFGRKGNPRHNFNVTGPWDPTNTFELLNYSASKGYHRGTTLFGWELGNELQADMPATTLASQYRQLKDMILKLWPGNEATTPWIIGPDENPDGTWLYDFLQACGSTVDAVTYHQYSGFGGDADLAAQLLQPQYWDKPMETLTDRAPSPPNSTGVRYSILEAYHAYQGMMPHAELWVGETASAWDSGKEGVTNAFVDSFWFVTQLGGLAQNGVATQCRQTLVGGAYELIDKHTLLPNPDYYVALLWNRIMGQRVLGVSGSASHSLVRVFAHCSADYYAPEWSGMGAVAVAIVNADTQNTVRIDLRGLEATTPRLEFRLTAHGGDRLSRSVDLNGKLLAMAADGSMPALRPTIPNASTPLQAHPMEISFVVFPNANASGCRDSIG